MIFKYPSVLKFQLTDVLIDFICPVLLYFFSLFSGDYMTSIRPQIEGTVLSKEFKKRQVRS